MKFEFEIGKKEAKLISLSFILAIGLAVAAQSAIQGHPVGEIVINKDLDLKGYNLKNVDQINGTKVEDIGSSSGSISDVPDLEDGGSTSDVTWNKCADEDYAGWHGDVYASCSTSCKDGEHIVGWKKKTNICWQNRPSWYDSYFPVERRLNKTGVEKITVSRSGSCRYGSQVAVTAVVACAPK